MPGKVWLKPPGLFELMMKRRNSLISLKPVKSGLVQEIPRDWAVSESGMIWRLVAVSGGTVDREGGRERSKHVSVPVNRHCKTCAQNVQPLHSFFSWYYIV